MSTRTYDREIIRYDRATIDILVEQGRAVYFPGLPGYVIDKKIPVRDHQIDEPAAVEDLTYLRSLIVDHDTDVDYRSELQRQAEAAGVSVEEFSDGEYTVVDGIAVLSRDAEDDEVARREAAGVLVPGSAEEDALLAKFL